jgi:1-pyrroline-5-carboxylate dehydrogenase
LLPHDHANHLCIYQEADEVTISKAIDGALAAKQEWESMPWNDRAAIFLKAADLVSGKYRYKLLAATILGQGKNVWQAEIDAAAEVSDSPLDLQNKSDELSILVSRLLQVWSQVC